MFWMKKIRDIFMKLQEKKGRAIVPVVLVLGIFIGAVAILQVKGIGATLFSGDNKLSISADDPEADPDGDGLKNWQEDIYKTDQRKYDTDGDGYSDGEEVLSGYDPTVAGPNDALPGTDTTIPRPLPKNLTDNLSQTIIEKIGTGEIQPIEDPNTAPDSLLMQNEDVLNEVLSQINQKSENDFILKPIPDSDIKIANTETNQGAVFAYLDAMSKILADDSYIKDMTVSEAEAIQNAVENKNYNDLNNLIKWYEKVIKDSKEVITPKDLKELHKENIEILILTKDILSAIRNFESDPATATAAANNYISIKDLSQNFQDKLIAKVKEY